jgi:hypothetical protein
MKAPGVKPAPVPQLSADVLQRLSNDIEQAIKSVEEGRRGVVDRIKKFRAFHQGDYSERTQGPDAGIFKLSNVAVPLAKGIATAFSAKVEDELVGGDSPLCVQPENAEDRKEADEFERYWKWELFGDIKFGESTSEGLAVVPVEGTAIKKRRWRTRKTYFPRRESRLHLGAEQVNLPDGTPIIEGRVQMVERRHSNPLLATVGMKERMIQLPDGTFGPSLKGDMEFRDVTVKDSVTHYDNAESVLIPFEDFLADVTAASLDDLDFKGHQYSIPMHELLDLVRQDMEQAEEIGEESGWVLDHLFQVKNSAGDTPSQEGTGTDSAQKTAPLFRLGESASNFWSRMGGGMDNNSQNPYRRLQLVECYMRWDADGDGWPEDIIVIWDRKLKLVLWCDWLVNHFEDCKDPFTAHAFIRIPGRWRGMGVYEYLDEEITYIDKVFSRMNWRTAMSANPMTWQVDQNFVVPPKQWGPGERVKLQQNAVASQSLGFWVMPQQEEMEWKFFQFFLQLVQLCTGMTNASQGDASSLPSSATATGVATIVEEGNKLYRMFIRRLKLSLEDEVGGLVRLIQQNVKKERVFRYRKGLEYVIARMSPEKIREMKFDVRVVLSKMSSLRRVADTKSAIDVVNSFMALQPEMMIRLRPMFVQLLVSHNIVDAEDILPSDEELKNEQQRDAMLQQAAEKIVASAQQVAGAQIAPEKQISQDLMGVAQMLLQIAARPPEAGGGKQVAAGGGAGVPQISGEGKSSGGKIADAPSPTPEGAGAGEGTSPLARVGAAEAPGVTS